MQTSNKHIFIVTYDYPPSNGGIARLCFELKKYLEKKGLNVTVICPQSTSTDAEEDNNVVRLHGRRGILELRTLKYLRKKTVPGAGVCIRFDESLFPSLPVRYWSETAGADRLVIFCMRRRPQAFPQTLHSSYYNTIHPC